MSETYEPSLQPAGRTNAFGEETYKLRVTFDGAAGIKSVRAKNVEVTYPGVGSLVVKVPHPYREITAFKPGWKRQDGLPALDCVLIADGGDGSFDIDIHDATGANADPADNDVLYLEIGLTRDLAED